MIELVTKARKYNEVIFFGYDNIGLELSGMMFCHVKFQNGIMFCDNSVEKQNNKDILSVEDAVLKYPDALYIITSLSHAREMKMQLMSFGIPTENIEYYHPIPKKDSSLQKCKTINIPILHGKLLENRVALITGGNRGIGYAIADLFLENGAKVIMTGRDKTRLDNSCQKLKDKYGVAKIVGIQLDITDYAFIEQNLGMVAEKYSVDILVNNAGVSRGDVFGKTTEEDFDMVLDTNLKGMYFVSQSIANYMVKNKVKGNILNILSSSSYRPALNPYTVSKWGARGLTLGMAKQLIPYDIVVNGIAPGPTTTGMLHKSESEEVQLKRNPSGRFVRPEEIANLAVVLVSDLGRMVVGDIVCATGGAGIITYDDMDYRFEFK